VEDRLVGKPVKKKTDNGEADYLGSQMRPVHAESVGDLLDLPSGARFRQQN
jgi:hypothetical protein